MAARPPPAGYVIIEGKDPIPIDTEGDFAYWGESGSHVQDLEGNTRWKDGVRYDPATGAPYPTEAPATEAPSGVTVGEGEQPKSTEDQDKTTGSMIEPAMESNPPGRQVGDSDTLPRLATVGPAPPRTDTPPATGSSYLDFLARKHQGLLGLFGEGSRTQPDEPDMAATDDTGGSTWVDYDDSGGGYDAGGTSAANPYGPDDAMREGGLHAARMGAALRGWMGAPQPMMPGGGPDGGYRTPAYAEGGASVDSFGNPTPAYAPSGEGRYPPWPGAYQTRQAMAGAGGGMSHTMPDGSTMSGPPMGGGQAPLPTTALGRDVRDRIAAAYAQGRVAPPQAGPLPAGVRMSGRTEVHRGGRNNRRGR